MPTYASPFGLKRLGPIEKLVIVRETAIHRRSIRWELWQLGGREPGIIGSSVTILFGYSVGYDVGYGSV